MADTPAPGMEFTDPYGGTYRSPWAPPETEAAAGGVPGAVEPAAQGKGWPPRTTIGAGESATEGAEGAAPGEEEPAVAGAGEPPSKEKPVSQASPGYYSPYARGPWRRPVPVAPYPYYRAPMPYGYYGRPAP